MVSLDDPQCEDPAVAGAKAAWLARGRRSGLPVLDGWVVPAPVSKIHLDLGVDALRRRGSGGARLEVSQLPLPEDVADAAVEAATALGDPVVVRSSSPLEDGSEWAGAFVSYADIHPNETPTAVTGCWASVFGVDTLARHRVTGVDPGNAQMAVLIQPAIEAEFGGTARVVGDEVRLEAVAGSPAPLVQGHEPGAGAMVARPDGATGPACGLMGEDLVEAVAQTLRDAHERTGATTCEWAVVGGRVVLFQLNRPAPVPLSVPASFDLIGPGAVRVARLVRRFPGPLGELLVLPWMLATPAPLHEIDPPGDIGPIAALDLACRHAATLTAEVWSNPEEAMAFLRELRCPHPGDAIDGLPIPAVPDPEQGAMVLALLEVVRRALVDAGAVTLPELGWHLTPDEIRVILATGRSEERKRIGVDRWEPFTASVTIAAGRRWAGTAASPGVGAGRLCRIGSHGTSHFRPRDVIVAPYPNPNLAPLLWVAAGLVTNRGGPGAHLFETARALGVPAVCGIQGDPFVSDEPLVAAIDGYDGSLYATDW